MLAVFFANPALAKGSSTTCLAKVMQNEAGGTNKRELLLVAETVLTRVEHEDFPNSICGVVKQPNQFAFHGPSPRKEIIALASAILEGRQPLPGVYPLYFHANWASPQRFLRGKSPVIKTKYQTYYR